MNHQIKVKSQYKVKIKKLFKIKKFVKERNRIADKRPNSHLILTLTSVRSMTITGRALTVNDPLLCATLNKCILFPSENSHPWKPLEQVGWQGNQLEKYSSEGHPKFRHEKTASKRFVINYKG